MALYRKKPVVIEALQLKSGRISHEECYAFCKGMEGYRTGCMIKDGNKYAGIQISTLEGTMRADVGDFIIMGVQGEFYPCKPDIFAETYEEV